MEFKKKVPNLVTGGRIVLFWIMMYLIAYTSGKFELAHVLFYFFAMFVYMLDSLDGYLARRFNATSEFGSQFDQCGDKLVAFTMILYIVSLDIYPAKVLIVLFSMTAIILFRDIMLNAFRLVSSRFQLVFETSKIGKFRAYYFKYSLVK